jgi:hypothetical protein
MFVLLAMWLAHIQQHAKHGSPNRERQLMNRIKSQLRKKGSEKYLKPQYRLPKRHPLHGHCYVAAQSLYHGLGGEKAGYEVFRMDHEGSSHWFLKNPQGRVLDPTASQFRNKPDYSKAQRAAFLHTQAGISQRSQKFLEAISLR